MVARGKRQGNRNVQFFRKAPVRPRCSTAFPALRPLAPSRRPLARGSFKPLQAMNDETRWIWPFLRSKQSQPAVHRRPSLGLSTVSWHASTSAWYLSPSRWCTHSGPHSNGASTGQRICTCIWLEFRQNVKELLYPELLTGQLQTWSEVVGGGLALPAAAKA